MTGVSVQCAHRDIGSWLFSSANLALPIQSPSNIANGEIVLRLKVVQGLIM